MPDDKRKPVGPRTAVVTQTSELDAEEERVIRALHGSRVPGDFPLPQKDAGLPDSVKARLRAIEAAAYQKSARLEELRQEAEAEDADHARREATRKKIVSGLRSAGPPSAKPPHR